MARSALYSCRYASSTNRKPTWYADGSITSIRWILPRSAAMTVWPAVRPWHAFMIYSGAWKGRPMQFCQHEKSIYLGELFCSLTWALSLFFWPQATEEKLHLHQAYDRWCCVLSWTYWIPQSMPQALISLATILMTMLSGCNGKHTSSSDLWHWISHRDASYASLSNLSAALVECGQSVTHVHLWLTAICFRDNARQSPHGSAVLTTVSQILPGQTGVAHSEPFSDCFYGQITSRHPLSFWRAAEHQACLSHRHRTALECACSKATLHICVK